VLAALALAISTAGHGDEPALRTAAHEALLRQAEHRLAEGDATGAVELLDRAAAASHDPDTEMSLVRAYMAQGQYRRALAFGAHAAGGHAEAPAATALYAWLLCVGGQCGFGQRLVTQALMLHPHDAVLQEAGARLVSAASQPAGELLAAPHRMAPYAVQAGGRPIDERVEAVATGVVLADGRHAVVPLSAVAKAASGLWLRDGLGRTTSARIEREILALDAAVAVLDVPWEDSGSRIAPQDAFAGSPAFAIAFVPSSAGTPAWPWLHAGFLGRASSSGARPSLGIEVPAHTDGAPLFDASGMLIGMAMDTGTRNPRRVPIGAVVAALGRETLPLGSTAVRLGADEVYERALRSVVQVLVSR
jgi:hypothetical protein